MESEPATSNSIPDQLKYLQQNEGWRRRCGLASNISDNVGLMLHWGRNSSRCNNNMAGLGQHLVSKWYSSIVGNYLNKYLILHLLQKESASALKNLIRGLVYTYQLFVLFGATTILVILCALMKSCWVITDGKVVLYSTGKWRWRGWGRVVSYTFFIFSWVSCFQCLVSRVDVWVG